MPDKSILIMTFVRNDFEVDTVTMRLDDVTHPAVAVTVVDGVDEEGYRARVTIEEMGPA